MCLLFIYILVNIIVQISIWYVFRNLLVPVIYYSGKLFNLIHKKLYQSYVIVSLFFVNYIASLIVLLFTGTGNMIGIANLTASIVVTIYTTIEYKKIIRRNKK